MTLEKFDHVDVLAAVTGIQDILIPGAPTDDTHKAAIIRLDWGTADGTPVDGASESTTYFDGTNTFCIAVAALHGGALELFSAAGATVLMLDAASPSTTVITAQCFFRDNGFRFNILTTNGRQVRVRIELFVGSDVNALVHGTDLTTQPGPLSEVVTTSFPVGLAYGMSRGSTAPRATYSEGCWVRETLSHATLSHEFRPSTVGALSEANGHATASYICQPLVSGALRAGFSLSAPSATTITVTATEHTQAVAFFLFLEIPFPQLAWTALITAPSTTGTWKVSDPGFTPIAAGLRTSRLLATEQAVISGSAAGAWGSSSMTTGAQYWQGISSEHGLTTGDAQSLSSDTTVEQVDSTGGVGHVLAGVQFNVDGFQSTASAADEPSIWLGWAIGTQAAPLARTTAPWALASANAGLEAASAPTASTVAQGPSQGLLAGGGPAAGLEAGSGEGPGLGS